MSSSLHSVFLALKVFENIIRYTLPSWNKLNFSVKTSHSEGLRHIRRSKKGLNSVYLSLELYPEDMGSFHCLRHSTPPTRNWARDLLIITRTASLHWLRSWTERLRQTETVVVNPLLITPRVESGKLLPKRKHRWTSCNIPCSEGLCPHFH